MAHLISFRTARFDVSREKPNDINPIAGQSVLLWLRDELAKAHYQVTEPETEDWGWYIDVVGAEASYLVGASADATDTTPSVEWIVQVHKNRSLKDKVLGRNKMAADDPLFTFIERLVRADRRIEQIDVTRDA
ncbi:MAG TPA: hypothetical protein VLK65_09525 [Vicinamibacteria bacterium]|nr:hypothetical protein [Vicinamibacteria bacterium]